MTGSRGPKLAFIDLDSQRRHLEPRITDAIRTVLEHGQFVLGPEVVHLERRLAERSGRRRVVTVGSGTDALLLTLEAWGIGRGDAVVVPAFTFAATAEVVKRLGATPIFCDVTEDGALLDPGEIPVAVGVAQGLGLRVRAVLPVGLYGQPVDEPAIAAAAAAHHLLVLGDAAQSFGATYDGIDTLGFGTASATSFYPSKPLGCYGDGGAVFTDDDGLADTVESLRMHGSGASAYDHVRVGTTSRLDTLQAAILLEKLGVFDSEHERRQEIAARYDNRLAGVVTGFPPAPGRISAWAQYTVRVPERDRIRAELADVGVPTAVHYPEPLHRQMAYRDDPRAHDTLPVSDRLAAEVLSLPMHPYLSVESQDRVVDGLTNAVRSVRA